VGLIDGEYCGSARGTNHCSITITMRVCYDSTLGACPVHKAVYPDDADRRFLDERAHTPTRMRGNRASQLSFIDIILSSIVVGMQLDYSTVASPLPGTRFCIYVQLLKCEQLSVFLHSTFQPLKRVSKVFPLSQSVLLRQPQVYLSSAIVCATIREVSRGKSCT